MFLKLTLWGYGLQSPLNVNRSNIYCNSKLANHITILLSIEIIFDIEIVLPTQKMYPMHEGTKYRRNQVEQLSRKQ